MRFCRSLIDHTAIIIIIVTKGSTSKSTSAAHIKRRLGSGFENQFSWIKDIEWIVPLLVFCDSLSCCGLVIFNKCAKSVWLQCWNNMPLPLIGDSGKNKYAGDSERQ